MRVHTGRLSCQGKRAGLGDLEDNSRGAGRGTITTTFLGTGAGSGVAGVSETRAAYAAWLQF